MDIRYVTRNPNFVPVFAIPPSSISTSHLMKCDEFSFTFQYNNSSFSTYNKLSFLAHEDPFFVTFFSTEEAYIKKYPERNTGGIMCKNVVSENKTNSHKFSLKKSLLAQLNFALFPRFFMPLNKSE